MPTTIDSAGITFNDTTTLTSANIGTAQLVNGSVTAAKLGTTEQKQIAKAWVNFNGTGTTGQAQTIRSSYNVSSVTKNGTGDYTVNFVTPMADANYAFTFGNGAPAGFGDVGALAFRIKDGVAPTSSSIRIVNSGGSGSIENTLYGSVAIFGN